MKRFFILILTALLLAVSCEKETEFPADKDGRIFVSAMLGTDGKDRISITVSQPALGEEDATAEDVALHEYKGSKIFYFFER